MSTADIKKDLINRINNLEDDSIIEQIQLLLDFEFEEGIYKLSEEQTQRIMEAREEYSEGKILSEKKANSEIEKWLNSK
ncbi:MAG: hypothetical protein ABIN48_10550 [Ginsengibacter sp.]